MKITDDDVRHLEELARIRLGDDERDAMRESLGNILEFVNRLRSVDTEGIAPTRLVSHGGSEHLREDTPGPSLDRDTVLAQAPQRSGDYFRVPRVIGKGDQ